MLPLIQVDGALPKSIRIDKKDIMVNAKYIVALFILSFCFVASQPLLADMPGSGTDAQQLQEEENAEELAIKLANPVARLMSIPLQINYDANIGSNDKGVRWTLKAKPVVPISLNENWNLVTRTILPIIWQEDIFSGAGSQSGIGDIETSLFFSPESSTNNGWFWGAGPIFLLPTGSDDLLTSDKWGAGPTAAALKQYGPWTYRVLANHIWSVAGEGDRSDISTSLLEPSVTYTTRSAVSFNLGTSSEYDWESEQWSVPLDVNIKKVIKFGKQGFSFGGGARYWVKSTEGGPEGWGFRLVFTLLFPK